jgi:hypothetical protein
MQKKKLLQKTAKNVNLFLKKCIGNEQPPGVKRCSLPNGGNASAGKPQAHEVRILDPKTTD